MRAHRLAALALAALLAPLMAACGGSPRLATAPTSMPAPIAAPAKDAPAAPVAPPAAAPTSMPAAEVAGDSERAVAPAPVAPGGAAAEPPASGVTASDGAAGAPASLPPIATPALPDVAPPVAPRQQVAPSQLRAGEIDDNRDFSGYQSYLASFQGYGVVPVDVSERVIVDIVNENQQPVLDAQVTVYDGQQAVFSGRTYAGGRTIFFPRALGLGPNSGTLRVDVRKGWSQASGQIVRGRGEEWTFVLKGAEALPSQPRLDVLFLLDATGSMGDEIGRIQDTITSIASRIDGMQPRPALRFGLVTYRDRGDAYVTRLESNFTGDVSSFRNALLQVEATGGGDNPEDMNAGLQVAMQQMSWSDDAVRLVFLVADAPAHMDYGEQFDYAAAAREAARRGVKVYPIGASNTDEVAEFQMRQLAQQTLGSFIFLTYQPEQNGGAPGDSTTMHVDPQQYTVERLDDLVVQVIEREMRQAVGMN